VREVKEGEEKLRGMGGKKRRRSPGRGGGEGEIWEGEG